MISRCLSSKQFASIPSCSFAVVTHTRQIATLPSLKLYSFRRRIAEKISNKYDEARVEEIGPDLACLEWLMECGSTCVEMSDGEKITRIRDMKEYIPHVISKKDSVKKQSIQSGDLSFEKRWPNAPSQYIVNIDASDSAISNEGFTYMRDIRRIEKLKLNFCDYFGDEGLKFLAQGRPAHTLRELEIVLNPCMTDGAVYWIQKLKALRRAHFYFLPYVSYRQGFIRQLKIALPKCHVTFPEVSEIGHGYNLSNEKKAEKANRK